MKEKKQSALSRLMGIAGGHMRPVFLRSFLLGSH